MFEALGLKIEGAQLVEADATTGSENDDESEP
jgi:hypothetical protein